MKTLLFKTIDGREITPPIIGLHLTEKTIRRLADIQRNCKANENEQIIDAIPLDPFVVKSVGDQKASDLCGSALITEHTNVTAMSKDEQDEEGIGFGLLEFIGVWGGTPVTSVVGGIAPAAPSGREKLSLLLSGRCILILLPLPGKALWKQRSQFWSNLLEKLLVRQDWISTGCLSTTPCGETRRCDAR